MTPTPREAEIERLAAALGNIGTCGHSSCPRDTSRHRDEAAELFDLGLRFPVPPDPGTAATDREARWPHRPTENIGPFCVGCSRWWPCPSQRYLNAVASLVGELAHEYHHSGSIRDHADPNDKTGWNVRGIETCGDPLCVQARALLDPEPKP